MGPSSGSWTILGLSLHRSSSTVGRCPTQKKGGHKALDPPPDTVRGLEGKGRGGGRGKGWAKHLPHNDTHVSYIPPAGTSDAIPLLQTPR